MLFCWSLTEGKQINLCWTAATVGPDIIIERVTCAFSIVLRSTACVW